jgi:hypothetical protein
MDYVGTAGYNAAVNAGATVRMLYDVVTGKTPATIHDARTDMDAFIARNKVEPVSGKPIADVIGSNSPLNPLGWPGAFARTTGDMYQSAAEAMGVPSQYSTLLGGGVEGATNIGMGLLAPEAAERGALTKAPRTFGADSLSAASAPVNASSFRNPELQEAFMDAQKAGPVNPTAAKNHALADSLPVLAKLTAGQALEDPALMAEEFNKRSKFPEIGQRMAEQNQNLAENLTAIRDQAGPDVFTTNAADHGQALIDAYKAKDAPVQADINAKYQALRDQNGGSFPIDGVAFAQNAQAALKAKLLDNFDIGAGVSKDLERYANGEPMDFSQFEALRTKLANIQRGNPDGNVRMAASTVRDSLEQLPLQGGAEGLKPLADAARAAAKARFDALRADPAYDAAVNDAVPPEKFVDKFLTGNSATATRAQAETMRRNFADNDTATQTMGVAAIDKLKEAARLDDQGRGNFAAAGYRKTLQNLGPRLPSLIDDPKVRSHLDNLGEVARLTTQQPRGGVFNNSGTASTMMKEYGASTLEGIANVAAKGIPVGTFVRRGLSSLKDKADVAKILKPGAGLSE